MEKKTVWGQQGSQARDWADVQEGMLAPVYSAVLRKIPTGPMHALLDIGCGAGMFCQMAAALGTQISGLDASEPFLAIARERVPQGNFRSGDLESLPYADHSFDGVTGFNSFQFAASPANALREARRVARSGAPVVITIWGKREDCDAARFMAALGLLLSPPVPAPSQNAPNPFALSAPGALDAALGQAGLIVSETEELDCPWHYPDEATVLRGLFSIGQRAMQQMGEAAVRAAVLQALEPFKMASGQYHLNNKFRYVIARA